MKRLAFILAILTTLLFSGQATATISLDYAPDKYSCDGVITSYGYTWQIYDDDELSVYVETSAGVQDQLTLNTDYTVTGAGGATGGNVVLTDGANCSDGCTLVISRTIDFYQDTEYVDGNIRASALETPHDKAMLLAQQQEDELGRCLKLKLGTDNTDMLVPEPESNKVLGCNALGELTYLTPGGWDGFEDLGSTDADKGGNLVSSQGGGTHGEAFPYIADPSATDHGDVTENGSIAKIEAAIDADEQVIVLPGNNTYVCTTATTISANVVLDIRQGALISGTIVFADSPDKQIIALPGQQIFADGADVTFTTGGTGYVGWYGDDTAAIQAAANSLPADSELVFSSATYTLSASVNFTTQCTLTGYGTTIQTTDDYVDAFYVTGEKTIVRGFTFEPTGTRSRTRSCLKVNADYVKVQDCFFLGNGEVVGEYGRGTALTFGSDKTNPDWLTVDKCYFKDFEKMIQLATSKNVTITNSYFTGGVDYTYAGANYGGTYLGDAIKISTPTAYEVGEGASYADADYTASTRISITNNKFININRDCVDTFMGGTNLIFSDNIITGVRMNMGLDIKMIYAAAGSATSIETYRQSRNVTIANNQFIDADCIGNWTIGISSSIIDAAGVPVAALDGANVIYSVIINGNTFENAVNPIVRINNTPGVIFTDNIVKTFQAGSNDEFVIIMESTGLSTPTVKRYTFSDNQISITDSGINLGFLKILDDAAAIRGMIISDNIYFGGEDDTFMSMGTGAQIQNLQASNNVMRGPTSAPWASSFFVLRDISDGNITNNQMLYCNIEAINIIGAEHLNITGNIIREAGQSTSDRDIRIDDGTIVAASNNVYIHHNILQDNGGAIPGFNDNTSGANIVVSELGIEATTAQLEDDAHAINTSANKVLGYQVFNTDTGQYVYAVGNADGDVWNYEFGGVAHTPV